MTKNPLFPTLAAALVGLSAALSALAALADPLPFRPDEAVLACQARAMHMIEVESGADAHAEGRFASERLEDHMWHVSGAFTAMFLGKSERVGVDCDVSSDGVEVFVMRIGG
ncbi:MAG: hypothetical protein AAF577_05900 [Pseudomonadota bacterium]